MELYYHRCKNSEWERVTFHFDMLLEFFGNKDSYKAPILYDEQVSYIWQYYAMCGWQSVAFCYENEDCDVSY